MTASTVSSSRLDGATWPPMEPMSALITLNVSFIGIPPTGAQVKCHEAGDGIRLALPLEEPKERFMAAKQFQFRADARQSILRGASVLADAVRVTLGPKSKCCA